MDCTMDPQHYARSKASRRETYNDLRLNARVMVPDLEAEDDERDPTDDG